VSEHKESEPAVIVVKAYDFTLWLLPKVEKFPRSFRFTAGERLVGNGLDLLLSLVGAAYSSDKQQAVDEAARKVNAVRYLLRLGKDLRLMSQASYAFASEQLEEIGRMAGGWRRSLRPRK
jgi:hypothetical protein